MKINDIVKWWFVDTEDMSYPYWSKDQQAVVTKRKNRIIYIDTYWGFGSSESYQFTNAAIKDGTIKIKKVCNLENVEEYKGGDPYKYFKEKDIFDLSYQNGCYIHIYVKKNAKRNKGVMLKALVRKIEEENRTIRMAKNNIEFLSKQKHEIESGVPLGKIYI